MAELISIGAASHIDIIKSKLDREFNLLQNDGMKILLDETPAGDFIFLGCNIMDYGSVNYSEEDAKTIIKHYIANIVSDIIINYWEKNLIFEIINNNYENFTTEERDFIYEYACKYLNQGAETEDETLVYKISRKSMILQKLMEYLHNNSKIVIEGFIRFRLKDYLQELEEVVEKAVDEYLMEKEYKEFIRLLKYFVEIQEPRVQEVNVVLRPSGFFKLLDEKNNNIGHDYLDGLILDYSENEISHEDLLISALITIAPNKITLHYMEQSKIVSIIDTIVNVFGERVSRCSGCELCNKSKKIEH